MTQKIEAPKSDSCEDCRYYRAYIEEPEDAPEDDNDPDTLTGLCRRYPPQVILSYPEPIAIHPDVAGVTGWCGEFTPKS